LGPVLFAIVTARCMLGIANPIVASTNKEKGRTRNV
jgi:hypothetical protein